MRSLLSLFLISLTLGCHRIHAQMGKMHEDPLQTHLLDRWRTLGILEDPHRSIRYGSWDHLLEGRLDTAKQDKIDSRAWHELLYSLPQGSRLYEDYPLPQRNKGLWGLLYKTPYTMWEVDAKDIYFTIEPILHLRYGDDRETAIPHFQNTRGIVLKGILDDKVYFSSTLLENQQRFLNYEESEITRLNAIPGQGFFKRYRSGVFDEIRGWDFLNAQAHVGFSLSSSIDLELGHGRHFIGDGIRSMLLSDYANNYFYLQLKTRVWKINYQNIFAELSPMSTRDLPGNTLLPKKYMATHYLSMDISSKLTVGLFESVIFSRSAGFELQYLNPLMLYRSVEQVLDSPDNVLLGLNMTYIPRDGWQLYGQILIDELRTDQVFSGRGWWGNKVAYQAGLKWYNALAINHLDIQVEYNSARPYTYAHRDEDTSARPATSYSHFNQPLAHPYGANFREVLLRWSYRPIFDLVFDLTLHHASIGEESDQYQGRDILLNYEQRPRDFDHFTGQGIPRDISGLHFRGSYALFTKAWLDVQWTYRYASLGGVSTQPTQYWGIGFRYNIDQRSWLL